MDALLSSLMGRPKENKKRLQLHVKSETVARIRSKVVKGDRTKNTLSKIVDNQFSKP